MTTKILKYISDIHLEFSEFPIKKDNSEFHFPGKNEILLVAGDTIPAIVLQEKRTDADSRKYQRRFNKFLSKVSELFEAVYMIGGNHDAYGGGDYAESADIIRDFISRHGYTNVHFLEKGRVTLKKTKNKQVDLLATTLWTDMNKGNPNTLLDMSMMMNDFKVCYYKGKIFTPKDCADLHAESLTWLKTQLLDTSCEFIVMTHHLPSFQSIDPHFKGDPMNFGYASSMEDFIYMNPHITHWIHGHTHYDVDYMIDHTRILANQRGYPPSGWEKVQRGNWRNFKANKRIKI